MACLLCSRLYPVLQVSGTWYVIFVHTWYLVHIMFNPKVRNRIDMFEQLVFFSPFYFPPSLRRLYSVRRLFTLDEYIVSEQARPVVKERCQPFPPVHALFFCGECGSAFPPARRFSPCFATSRSSSAFGERRRWFHRGSNFLQQG